MKKEGEPRDGLLSHRLEPVVSWALQRFTSRFGMETGWVHCALTTEQSLSFLQSGVRIIATRKAIGIFETINVLLLAKRIYVC